MALFQYQAKTSEATQPAGPESVSVDRWQPTWVQPSRALASVAALVAGSFAPVLAPSAPAATPTDWIQQQPQPSRAFGPRLADALAAPVLVPPVALGWHQQHPQPNRTPRYASGSAVVVVSTSAEASTADRWQPTTTQPNRPAGVTPTGGPAAPVLVPVLPLDWVQSHPQPSRVPRYAPGSGVVVVSTAAESVSADRFQPVCPQPSARPVRPPDATVSPPSVPPALDWLSQQPQPGRRPSYTSWSPSPANVAPIASGEVVTPDKWLGVQPQPSRAQRYAAGSGVVVVSTAAEATSADRWLPTATQPAPRPTRPTGGTAAPVLVPAVAAAPSTDWIQSQPQPARVPRYAPGSSVLTPVTAAEAVTADRWLPTWTQPAARPVRPPGSVVAPPAVPTPTDWLGRTVQPRANPTRAAGSTASPVLVSAAAAPVPTDWLVQQPQPGRSVRYARGTASVGAGSAAFAGGFNAACIVRSYVLGQGVNEVYQRNTAGQTLGFNLVTIAGADAPAASVTVLRVIDAGTQSAAGGAVTAKGGGQYSFAPTAADLNGDAVSFLFSATGCVSCERTVITTGVLLLPAGLDSIPIEAGLNARQALSLKAAHAAGSDAYDSNTGNVVIYAAGQAMTPENVRIRATTSSTGRTTTISPPP